MNNNKTYFFQTWIIVLIAIVSFIGFKSFLPKKLFPETSNSGKNTVVDSLMLDAIAEANDEDNTDTLSNTTIKFESNPFGIQFPDEKYEDYNGYQHLIPFYEKLYQLETSKKGKSRIAYFGDSMTDGDMIVQDIRTYFQNKFGGEGVGFVNITSESAASRGTIVHEFSVNWKAQSYLKTKKPLRSFGVNGHVFFANDTLKPTWVKYKAIKKAHLTSLNNPTLFFGKSTNKNASIRYVIGKDTLVKKMKTNQMLNSIALSGSTNQVKVNFIKADSIPIYGINFDNGLGIHVDNFSTRGNSGLPLGTMNIDLMNAFQQQLGYDLIVLQFGTNVLNYGTLNYSWYERKMKKVVEHVKKCFPNAAILIVTTADKSTKYELEMKTDSAVVPLTKAQKRYAVQSNTGFVNLYMLMGGNGSMVKWVEEAPIKANKDYTHFNHRGAKEAANLIYNKIMFGYELYKKLRIETMRKKKKATIKKDSTKVEQIKDSIGA